MGVYLIYFIFSIILTYLLIVSHISFFKKNNFLLKTDDYKRKNIVNGTGITIFFSIAAATIISLQFYDEYQIKFLLDIFNKEIPRPFFFLISLLLITILGFIDDVKPIDYRIRLFFQFSIIFFSLSIIEINFFDSVPLKLKQYVIVILWVYFINIYNFLDGLDGYLIICFLKVLIIVCIKYFFEQTIFPSTIISFIMFPIFLTVLFFNFPKAKIFLGDSGSYLIGFIIGYIFFEFIKNENYYLAYLIILYPFLDVTLTIIVKVYNGKKPWERLFDYFFLKPVIQNNVSHLYSTIPIIIYSFLTFVTTWIYYANYLNVYILILINFFLVISLLFYFNNFIFFFKKNKKVQ